MVAYPLIFGELTSESYTDNAAKDPRIDALRAKITCVEDTRFSTEYHEPEKRSISNALLVELNDGTVLDEVEIEYPVGHKRRREEGTPLLLRKFENHIKPHFPSHRQKESVWVRTPIVHITDFSTVSWSASTMRRVSTSSPFTSSLTSS